MKWNTEPADWLHMLGRNDVLTKPALDFLHNSIEGGGFVAGGFARSLAAVVLSERGGLLDRAAKNRRRLASSYYQDTWDSLSAYCDVGKLHPPPGVDDRTWKAGVGDVDVFFRSQDLATAAVQRGAALKPRWSSPTLAGFGHEYLVGNAVFQHIVRIVGTPEEVLSTFDIANARVYADSAGIHYTDSWRDMEDGCLLGIDNFTKPNLLWRVAKWFKKHHYVDFRPGDHSKFVDALWASAERSHGGWKMWGKAVSLKSVQRLGRIFLDLLPPADLLRASVVFDEYDRNVAIRHLVDGPETQSQGGMRSFL